jgi:hypothetical protein
MFLEAGLQIQEETLPQEIENLILKAEIEIPKVAKKMPTQCTIWEKVVPLKVVEVGTATRNQYEFWALVDDQGPFDTLLRIRR